MNNMTKDGICPYCHVRLNVYWHYGLDGHPWCWCQNCHNFVVMEKLDKKLSNDGDVDE